MCPIRSCSLKTFHDHYGHMNRGAKRRRVSVTVAEELLEWVEAQVGVGKRFASISHAVEMGLAGLRDSEE